MTDRKDMYLESKQAVFDRVTEQNQHSPVPACPGWSIHDVIAHLVGQLQDVATGNTEGGGTDAWTAKQVDRFREVSLPRLLTAWDQAIVDAGNEADDILRMIVPDLIVHEFDIRGALGNRENRRNPALLETAINFIHFQQDDFASSGLPAVEFTMDGHTEKMGKGDAGLSVTATPFEVARFIIGRRSLGQILELDWSSDPTPWLDHMLLMPPRETDLIE